MAAAIPAAAATPGPAALTRDTQVRSLYVGDLPTDLPQPEDTLFNLFTKVGMVVSIKVCRDINSQRSLGYAYVNYQNPADAETAIRTLNFHEIRPGRQIRVMYSQRDPSLRKSGTGNVFVKNLSPSITTRMLHDRFSTIGTVLSCKIACEDDGKSRGYGFVHFESEASAQLAIDSLSGKDFEGQPITVMLFKKKAEREKEEEKVFRVVFIKNLDSAVDEEALKKAIDHTTSIFVSGHPQHTTKFALVTLESHEDAARLLADGGSAALSSLAAEGCKIFMCRAVKKRDRLVQRAGAQNSIYQSQGRNVYVKHLEDTVTEADLRATFERFGQVTSVALMRDAQGTPRGFGFVCFDVKESATQAIRELNGKPVFSRRPLYVSQAMHKDMRHRLLEDQRKQMLMQHQRMAPPVGPYGFSGWPNPMMPTFPPRAGPVPGQVPPMHPSFMPMRVPQMRGPPMPQRGYGGLRPPMPPGPFGVPSQLGFNQPPPPPPPRGMMGYSTAQSTRQGTVGGITSLELSKMTPDEQKNALGERLYAKIQDINPQQAAKITGMLLEMDTPEILNVLEDRNMLVSKVAEAVAVLRQHSTH